MTEPITLPPGVALAILAFLLSLLPAGLFMWLWYLRRHDRPVPVWIVVIGFIGGAFITAPAFWLEKTAPRLWTALSPATVHYYDGAILPLSSLLDILLPAVGTFIVVATVEEGLRYFFLWLWLRFNPHIDQVFDGLVVGLAAGLGFATVENTIYFFSLFSQGSFDTLVFVFFLRFIISTLAHISFGGIMGTLLARGFFSIYRPRLLFLQAFLLPWFLHGLYDWLLGINLSVYAVLVLLAPLFLLIIWSERRDFFVLNRVNGQRLIDQRPAAGAVVAASTGWNQYAPWLTPKRRRASSS
jgi:RsiW-degrading membrane proteinase PrsW (M82 family)